MSETQAYAERLLAASMSTYELFGVYVGLRLGWFAALAEAGLTSTELAERTGTQERYCREFCEFQAALGTLHVVGGEGPLGRRYVLPAGPAEVLLDEQSLDHLGPLARMAVSAGRRIDDLLTAYRDGGGVSWEALGADARESQAALNRPWFTRRLGPALSRVPALHEVLARPGARILDVGCGGGWSTLALACAYPDATVVGVDVDAASVASARSAVAGAGLADRVTILLGEGERLAETEPYDAAFAFECLHDMPRPVEVLAAVRAAVRPGGPVVIMDEAVDEEFTAPGSEVDRCMYGFSLFICLPDGLASAPSAGTGTVLRPATLADYARQAGFTGVDVLPIEDFGFFRFYRLS